MLQSPIWNFQKDARVLNMDFSEQVKSPEYQYLDAGVVSLVLNANNHCCKLFQNLINKIDRACIFVFFRQNEREIKRSLIMLVYNVKQPHVIISRKPNT